MWCRRPVFTFGMDFTLVDSGWGKLIDKATDLCESELRVVCPFIKQGTILRLLAKHPKRIQFITRFNLADFASGVSDLSALRTLLDHGAEIRGVRGLHAKLYLFGSRRAIVTSANLTAAAMERNHELGFVGDEEQIVTRCRAYFDALWSRAGSNLIVDRVDDWEQKLEAVLQNGAAPTQRTGLGDEGVDTEIEQPTGAIDTDELPSQSFVKFFGRSEERQDRKRSIFEEVQECGSHWAATYPRDRRPRGVEEGAVMFIARLVRDPDDTLIHGRAVAMAYRDGRDDASSADLKKRPWKQDWPHYIRLHHAEFVAGPLANGVPLSELMSALGSQAFARTQEHALLGDGNTNPRKSIRQQPAVELSQEGYAWLQARLSEAFARHGKIPAADMETLDWPAIPASGTRAKPVVERLPALSPTAQRLLRILRGFLAADWIDLKNPRSFPSYTTVLNEMGITPWEDARLGPQFENQAGGRELNEWLRDNRLPALTGLIVNKGTARPGGEYFKSNGRAETDEKWWLGEVSQAKQWTTWPTES